MKTFIFIILQLLMISGFSQKFTVNGIETENNITNIKNPKSFYVSHSSSHIILNGNTPSCNNGQYHYENSYYLAYDLKNDFNITGDWIVNRVDIAVEKAVSGTGNGQPLIVKLWVTSYYNHEKIILDSLTLIAADTVTVSDNESGTLKSIDFTGGVYTVADGKVLVTEFLLPDGQEDGNLMFLGSNNSRISDSTYIKAPFCGVEEPVNVSEILFPDVMLIADIYGEYANPDPIIQSFLIEGQVADTEIKNSPDYTVKLIMPADTSLTALTPQIQIPAGFQITPASGEVTDFSQGSVVYTVDNNFAKVSQSWDVFVENAGPDIIGVSLPELNGDVVISGNPDFTVTVPVAEGSDLANLSPEIFVYDGFTVTPPSGSSVDFSSGQAVYNVSHTTLPLSQDWQVNVVETPVVSSVKQLNDFDFNIYPNPADDFIFISSNPDRAEITDLSGKIILKTNKNRFRVSDIKEGFYFLRIYKDEKSVTEKILILH